MTPKTILITGSKGLIGSAVSQILKSENYIIRAVDIRQDKYHPDFGSIENLTLMTELMRQCSGILHLGGVSRVISGEQNPQKCWDLNAKATKNLLQIAHSMDHSPWFIYASSREVYGQQDRFPVQEDFPLKPMNIYARSKVAAEEAVREYQLKGMQCAILRFSNVYGSVFDWADRVIPAFCRAASSGGILRIDGGENLFDFTHIEDVSRGVVEVIKKLEKEKHSLPPIHFVSGKGTTLIEAAHLAISNSIQPVNQFFAPYRSFDVHSFYGDPSRAKTLLGWQPSISIETGIRMLVNAYREFSVKCQEQVL